MANYLPWTEVYRPHTLSEVIGQKETVEKLKAYVKAKNIMNMIFAGPAGTGKTTCALALAHDVYGEDYKHNILELNASDERGIDVVRGKIKDFSRSAPLSDVPWKVVFLDEADALTPEAQQALRRTMELYAGATRFILSCNYSSKIIPPIESRCAVFRFKPLAKEEVAEMIKKIAEKEGLEINGGAIDALIQISEGDMRKTINTLQSISLLTKKITEEEVYKVSAAAKPDEIASMIKTALEGDFLTARKNLNQLLIEYGMSGEDVLNQIYKDIIERELPERKKAEIIDKIGEYNFRMVEGANERIQLEALLAYLMIAGKE